MDLWSDSVDWCGSKSYNLHTSVDRTTPALDQHCQPLTKLFRAAATTVVSFNREDVEWAKYKNKQVGVWCDRWSSCCNVIRMCWMARHHPVADWPFIRDLSGSINQMTVFEIIIAILRCLWDCMLAYYSQSCKYCCEFRLCLASSAHVKHARYRMISGHHDNCKVASSTIDIAITPNWYEPWSQSMYSNNADTSYRPNWAFKPRFTAITFVT